MRALLLKECRQNHLLPWGGLMVSATLTALCALWTAVYARTQQDQADLGRFVSIIVMVGSGVVVMVIGSGLISSETGTGALTYLLGLPVSRSRIWLAKVIAGVGLGAAAVVLLAVPVGLAVPGAASNVGLRVVLYLPDLAAIGLGVFSVTLLCSTLLARTLTVLLVAPAVVVAAAVGVVLAMVRDITPLRYDAGVADLSLWALVLAAPFLFASWVTFTRGELLDSRRRWLLAVPTLLAGVAFVSLLMFGAARWQQRYVRGTVQWVAGDQATVSPYGDVAAVLADGNRAPLARDEKKGWSTRDGLLRSSHTVVVDLRTGRDLVAWPGQRAVAFMPDGRRVIVAMPLGPFNPNARRAPQVWDMNRGRRLSERAAQNPTRDQWEGPGPNYGPKVPWSPDGKWLVYIGGQKLTKDGMPYGQVMMTMRADGSPRRKVTIWDAREEPKPRRPGERLPAPDIVVSATAWAPDDTLYLLTKGGELSRYSPEDGARTVVWRRPSGPQMEWMWYQHRLSVSPDGRLIAVRMPELGPSRVNAGAVRTWILGRRGAQVVPVTDFTDERNWQPLIWSRDGSTLYVGPFLRWHQGQPSPTVIRLPAGVGTTPVQTTVLPFDDKVLIQEMGKSFVADAQGRVRPLRAVYPKLTVADRVDGVDTQGRLVVVRSDPPALALLDPKTGDVKKVYP